MFDYPLLYQELYHSVSEALTLIRTAQQECEECCLSTDEPDYHALYLHLFGKMEDVRVLLQNGCEK